MKITICRSLKFAKEMDRIKEQLTTIGHEVLIPASIEKFGVEVENLKNNKEIYLKIAHTYIKKHFDKIVDSDAILVVNLEKYAIENYIGGNTFAEIMLAFYQNKKIFLLNPIPTDEKLSFITNEIEAIKPIVLNGNLDLIK